MNRIRQHTADARCGNGLAFAWSCCWPLRRRSTSRGLSSACRRHADAGVHAGHGHEGHDHSNLAHHRSSNACLQCLVMGGMSLAGAASMPEPAPHAHAIATGWALTDFAWDSRVAGTLGCRGPPARPDSLASPFPFHFGLKERRHARIAIACCFLRDARRPCRQRRSPRHPRTRRSRRRFDLQGRAARRPRLRRAPPPRPSACRSPKA